MKTRLCVRGRQLLYSHCDAHSVPYRKIGKLVVAGSDEVAYLQKLHAHCQELGKRAIAVPTELISGDQARELEPDLSEDITMALWSKETGIVDSHALMDSLEEDIAGSEGGEVVLGTKVVRVDPQKDGWVVQMVTEGSSDPDVVLAKTLINASGLASHQILNTLLPQLKPPQPRIPIYYARGSYAAYRGPGVSHVKRLIYPVPEQGAKHAFHSLGTHLTLDMNGNVRFGPDIEWIEPPSSGSTDGHSDRLEDVDFWKNHLNPSSDRLQEMYHSISRYLRGISLEGLSPDYVGVRPKLMGPGGGGFQDFVVRVDWSGRWTGVDKEGAQMITLMGIESPGLTSSLAIGEMVVEEVLKK